MQKEHYNLYYLFLEDKLSHPLSEAKRDEIRNVLIEMFERDKTEVRQIELKGE